MNLLLGFGKHRPAAEEQRVESKMQRSHSWDSTFRSIKLKSMKKRDKQCQPQRGGFGVRERQLQYDQQEEDDMPSSSRRLVLWNRKDIPDLAMEEEMPPVSKEVQQQLFMQRLFLISKQHLDETPPERRMSLLSTRSPEGTAFSGKDLEPQRSLLTIGPQGSYISAQQTSGMYPLKRNSPNNQVAGKGRRHEQAWTVETVVTNLTSSCTVFDSLCTPSFSLLTSTRPQAKRPDGPIPPAPPNKRRTANPLETPIPIPVTISFTKNGPPLGWEDLSLERHFAELEKYEKDMGLVDTFDDTDPILEDRKVEEEEDQESATGFISLTSSIPTRRSHGLWSTTDIR